LLLILFLLSADQLSKYLVRRWIDTHESIDLLPFLSLENVKNSGIAFGMLQGHSGLIIFTSSAIVLLLVVTGLAIMHDSRFLLPLAFLVGGSVGNLIDRFASGHVTDFLRLPHWPAFNLADVFIVTGVALLMRVFMLEPEKKEEEKEGDGRGVSASV
jgi:signal peptidase II